MTRYSTVEIDLSPMIRDLRCCIAITKIIQDEGFMGMVTYL